MSFTRRTVHNQYYQSDIFNLKEPSQEIKPTEPIIKKNINRQTVQMTKNNIFHTETAPNNFIREKRQKQEATYTKYLESNIFDDESKLNKTLQENLNKRRNINNKSSCFEPMKNLEDFKRELKNYTSRHRGKESDYNPDKYVYKETPAERYYKEVFDEKYNQSGSNAQKSFAQRKMLLHKNINKKNNENEDSKKQETNKKDTDFHKKLRRCQTERNLEGTKYVEPKDCTKNMSEINRQLGLRSNIFHQKIKLNDDEFVKKVNKQIESNRKTDRLQKMRKKHIMPRSKSTYDRNLWGAIHNNWENYNLDWLDPQTEIMFKQKNTEEINNKQANDKNEKTTLAFRRKLNQLADTKNSNTITGNKNIDIKNCKPINTEVSNHGNLDKITEIVNDIPNTALNPTQKKKIIMNSTTSSLYRDEYWDDKAKALNNYYTVQNKVNAKKEKDTKVPLKIMGKPNKKEIKETQDNTEENYKASDNKKLHHYTLTYSTKPQNNKNNNNLDLFNNADIQKYFVKEGVFLYNISKNHFSGNNYNTIDLQVRDIEDGKKLNDKINKIKDKFNKDGIDIKIEKFEEKEHKKNLRNIINVPNSKKVVFFTEKELKYNQENPRKPNLPKNKGNFSKQFQGIDLSYKKIPKK